MTTSETIGRLPISQVLERYGRCLELVSMDPHFHDISVGLYFRDGVATVWTFSLKPGAQDRIRAIRDQMVTLGGLTPVANTHNQVTFPCGHLHTRPVKFLLAQAVGKSPDYAPLDGAMSIRDTKTKLTLTVTGSESDSGWHYQVSGEGEAPSIPARLRLVVAGFVRYGEMEKVGDDLVTFPCRWRHDELVRLLLPYSRNVSAVENMMDAEALRGQMTTGTLGFTPT